MPLTAADIAKLNKLGTPELRALALAQLQKTEQALAAGKKTTDDISWWQQPLRFNQYVRWKPESEAIEEARKIISTGDAEKDDKSKRARYSEAYRLGHITAESIAKEAKLPPTNFTTAVYDPIAVPVTQFFNQAIDKAKEPLGDIANAAAVAGVLWLVYTLVKK